MNGDSSELIQFIGRLHVLLVHLPIGFIVLLAVMELLTLLPRLKHVASASRTVAILSVLAVSFSAACGWVLSWNGGYEEQTLAWHKWLGTALAPVTLVLAILHWRNRTKTYRIWLFATVVLLAVTGHFGGSLTHGSDYLFSFKKSGSGGSKPPEGGTPNDSSNQPVFATIVQPVFNKYCVSCHGPEKSKAKLRLDTAEDVFKGGDYGPVVESGNADQSLLIKRMLLPEDSDEHMPPSGKNQPTADEIALLKWWVNIGAPTARTVEELKMPETK